MLRAICLALCVVLASACGDDGGGGDGGIEDGGSSGFGGSSGTSGAGGSGGGNSGCLDPLDQDLVFPPTNLSDGSVIYKVMEDDGVLYFSTIDRLYRVEASGGTPEEIYYKDLAIVVKFWVRADDILILSGGDTLLSLPKEGGATTELMTLPLSLSGGLDGEVDMIVEGDYAYAMEVLGAFEDRPESATFYEIDLVNYEAREVVRDVPNLGGSFIKAGDALYVAADDPSVVVEEGDFGAFVPDLLYRVPLDGGDPEQLEVISDEPMRLGMLGAAGDVLYMLAASENDFAQSGVFRIDTSGGELEKVYEQVVLFGLTFTFHKTQSHTLLRYLDSFFELPDTGMAEELFCVGGGEYTSHGNTATDDAVYMSLFHSSDEETFIVRMPLD